MIRVNLGVLNNQQNLNQGVRNIGDEISKVLE